MKQFIILFSFLFVFILSANFAQLTVKDQDSTPNILLQINDEGNSGSITLPPLSSIGTPVNKLYNIGSFLFWNGIALGTSGSAAGWTDLGSNVILSSPSDKVGIGSTNPIANLHILGSEGLLVQNDHLVGIQQNLGDGTRLHYYGYKSAFRAGYAVGDVWDDVNIGEYSVAMCLGTKASGFAAIAFGEDSYATGWSSTALGMNTYASGWGSTTLGIQSAASGYGTVSIGNNTKAESFLSIALGVNNIGGGTTDSWDPDDPLIEIGNGYGGAPSNAVTVIKNGNVGIGIHNPSYKLDINGGNIIVRGTNGFTAPGHTGTLHLGSVHHYIQGEYGFGLKIGTYAAGNVISIKEISGNVGIGTIDPDARLEVNGDVKIGVNGIKFSEIIELTGTTGSTGTSSIYVDYPGGYTAEYSRVLSLEIEDPYGGWASNGLYYNGATVHCYLWSQIKIGYPNHADFQSRPFRLVLMKVE